jgi:branched-chain amino acid transport system substrate-binding protein
MIKRTLWVLVFLAGISSLLFLSCSNPREVRVGVVGPLSGEQEAIGKDVLNGVQIAVDEWNAKGGVHGKAITLISLDDQNQPTKAAEMAYLLSKRDPLLVIGHVDSGCSLEAAKIYQDHHIIMITPTSTTPKLTDLGYKDVFRVCGRDDMQGRAAAIWVVKHNMGERVGVVDDGTAYGKGLAQEFKNNYEFLSNSKILFENSVVRGDPVMGNVLKQCNESNPDLVFFGGLHQQGGTLLKRLRQEGINAVFMAGDGCFGKAFIDAAGPEVATGALVTFYPDLSTLPGTHTQAFLKSYEDKFEGTPGPYSIFGYKAADVGLTAAANAVTPLTDRTLRDSLHRLTFETPFGLMRFCDKGDPSEFRYVVWRADGDRFVELGS